MSPPRAMVLTSKDWREPLCVVEAVDTLTSGGFTVQAGEGQEESAEGLLQSRCAVVFGVGGLPLIVESLSEAPVAPPLIVVQRNRSKEAKSLAPQVYAVLSRGEVVPDLLRVATGALVNDVFRGLREAVRGNNVLSRHGWVQRALMLALTEPFTSVQALAVRMGCSPRSLSSWWAAANQGLESAGAPGLPLPKHFLRTICFLRIVAAWLTGPRLRSRWGPIAVELGVHRTTITRLVRNMTGKPPKEVRLEQLPQLVTRIEEELLGTLRGGEPTT